MLILTCCRRIYRLIFCTCLFCYIPFTSQQAEHHLHLAGNKLYCSKVIGVDAISPARRQVLPPSKWL